jgi:uncharacterized protein (DUF362 family)
MKVSHEGSMRLYMGLAERPQEAPTVNVNPRRISPYKVGGRDSVALVRCGDRGRGILEALRLLGGLKPLIRGVEGEIVIKPNCNTDDPYPRDTHPDTVRAIAEAIIEAGAKPRQIVVGDMSGRARGLPTRATMENLGLKAVADELGLQLAYFEEEPWVRVKPLEADYWPDGLVIPRRIYEAERIIFTPILRSHTTATFTCAMKLAVGLIDARSREWLHDGEHHIGKLLDINSAYTVDLVVADALKMNTGYGTDAIDEVAPSVIVAGGNMVVCDAVAVAIMRHYGTVRVVDKPVKAHDQFSQAQRIKLGSPNLRDINLKTLGLAGDEGFRELVSYVEAELED